MKSKTTIRKTRYNRNLLLCTMALWCNLFLGCDFNKLVDPLLETEEAIEGARAALQDASADWQQVLTNLGDDLDRLGSELASDVENILNASIIAMGSETRCTVDFLFTRLQLELDRLLVKHRNQDKDKTNDQPVPEIPPTLCNILPNAIDMAKVTNGNLNRLTISGHGLDSSTVIQAYLINGSRETNVSKHLDLVSSYQMTLNLGYGGVPLERSSKRIVLKWKEQVLSSIAIIQTPPPSCRAQTFQFTPSPLSFIPPHTRGDREFGGKPKVSTKVAIQYYKKGHHLRTYVKMTATELGGDRTTASGSTHQTLRGLEEGWEFWGFLDNNSPNPRSTEFSMTHEYRDNDWHIDRFNFAGGPVRELNYVGDTKGDEAGDRTGVGIVYHQIRYQVKELPSLRGCVD